MALEGGVPALYAPQFAAMQVVIPDSSRSVADRLQVIDDAGRFLDAWGQEAERLGLSPDALLGPGGLVWALKGRSVVALTREGAQISDGQSFRFS